MVGGDMEFWRSTLWSNEGSLRVESITSTGETPVSPDKAPSGGFDSLGRIWLVYESTLGAGPVSGGDVVIRGGDLRVDARSTIESETLSEVDAGGIDCALSGELPEWKCLFVLAGQGVVAREQFGFRAHRVIGTRTK